MSSIPNNRYDEAIFAIGIIKKVTGEKRQGVVPTSPGRPRVNKDDDDDDKTARDVSVPILRLEEQIKNAGFCICFVCVRCIRKL